MIHDGTPANVLTESKPYILPTVQQALVDGFVWLAKVDLENAYVSWKVDEQLARHQCFRDTRGNLLRWINLIWGTNVAPEIQ